MTRSTFAMTLTLTLGLAGPLAAQLSPLAGDFDASATSGLHARPTAAAAKDGSVRLVWSEPFVGLRSTLVKSKKPTGSTLLVANQNLPTPRGSGTIRERHSPTLAKPVSDGSFWMAWTQETKWVKIDLMYYDESTLDEDVYAGRFNRDGTAIGKPIRLHPAGDAFQNDPSSTARPGGGLLTAWAQGDRNFQLAAGDGIHCRALDRRGRTAGPDLSLDEGQVLGRNPSLASGGAEVGALVAWEGSEAPDQPLGIWVRALDASTCEPTGSLARIDDGGGFDQQRPSVTALSDGSFLVVWQSAVAQTITGRPHVQRTAIAGRRLAADGAPLGPVFAVSDGSAEQNTAPNVAALADGRAVTAWLTWTPENWPMGALGAVIDNEVASAEVDMTNWRVRDTVQPALAAAGKSVLLAWSAKQPQTGQALVAARRFAVD